MTINRRSSFEIADEYIEFNFKPIIDAEKEESMTRKERRRLRKEERRRERKKHYVRNGILATLAMLVVTSIVSAVWWNTSSSPVNRLDKNTRQFVVDKGATTDDVAKALLKAGFIKNQLAFKIYVRLHGSLIQAGAHMLSPSYSLPEIVARLITADTDEINVQIPPGLTLNELKDILKKYDYTDSDIEKALSANYDYSILTGRPEGATLEGYIYPDTYRVYGGDGPEVVIGKAIAQMQLVAEKNDLINKFKEHGLNFYQGVTLASIVTKEVKNEEDQKKVAGVFYNRLHNGMNLGSDVTYMYAYKMGYCAVNTPNDCDSTYNTRTHEGLPPGPIANPSLKALLAVASPTDSNYLYFVAGEDGKTYYSETVDEHNKAVADHCGSLCQ